jgi:hypothetical protein
MKTQIAAILGLALLAAASASAQNTKTNPMKVPVAFMAGENTFPAGEYRVEFNIDSGAIVLLNSAGPVASMITFRDGQGNGQDAIELRLVGNTWILQRVAVNGRELKLVPSKFEKRELAKLKPTGREALIAFSAPAR